MSNDSKFTKFIAEQCAKEPIHIPGSIQAHGILFALRASDLTILQVSENVYDVLGLHTDELLHQPLARVMDIKPVEHAALRLGEKMPRLLNPIPLHITVGTETKEFDGILHRSGRIIILELETHITDEQNFGAFGNFYETTREVSTQLMSAENMQQTLQIACDEVRKITGYSRVLVYKFDEDWNGIVVNESKAPHVKSLLHHRFPSTDIPKQARDLYTVNWLRIIPNVNYIPSPLTPIKNPITDKPLDLSNSVLRSVSPIHLEYMRNMGQLASMSISLLNNKKLWGLIACHNEHAKYLNYDTRVAAEFIGQMTSSQITARENIHEIDHAIQLKALFGKTSSGTISLQQLLDAFKSNSSTLLHLADATGVAICIGENITLLGACPSRNYITKLRGALQTKPERLFYTDEAKKFLPDEEFQNKAAGFMAITLDNKDQIIWFRPEMTEKIMWSGNPELSKEKGATGELHPRKSFETWLENVGGRSTQWRNNEIESVSELLDWLSTMPTTQSAGQSKNQTHNEFRKDLEQSLQNSAATKQTRDDAVTDGSPQLKVSEDKSRALLEGIAEFAIIFLNTHGIIENWSAGAKRLLGFNSNQIIGQTTDAFLSEDEVAKDKHRRLIEYVSEHSRCEEELWLYRADRSSFWGKIMVAAIRNDEQDLVGFTFIVQDFTKEKSDEEELRATKIAAEAANDAKTAFLANISHEIRTPLGAILGFAEIVSADSTSPKERHNYYERIRHNGEQLTSLINDLLDMTKVEANRLQVESLEFDLSELIKDVTDTLNVKAIEKGVHLETKVHGPVLRNIVSDPKRLRQILVNLTDNAIKFTPNGGSVTIEVSMFTSSGRRRIQFRIVDTGRGMNEMQMSHLFQPFVQADASTTRQYGGTGLGLFVSQRLARLLNGNVAIESSSPGIGSVFVATISAGHPNSDTVFTELNNRMKYVPLNEIENNELKGVKVLVVDDSSDNRTLLEFFLQKAGAIVSLAENGQEGINKALSENYDLVLMDIQMPVVDGNTAMTELKNKKYAQPVIALTAHAMPEERERSLKSGFVSYLTKPIARDILVRTIRQFTVEKDS